MSGRRGGKVTGSGTGGTKPIMCQISNIAGAAGGGPPGKLAPPTDVGGAAGAPPTKVAGDSGGPKDAKGGGPESAVAGANALGGGAPGSLQAALDALKAAVQALAEAVSKMGVAGGGGHGCGGAKVAGVQGQAAARTEFVARAATTTSSGGKEDDWFEQRVHELINQERAKHGLAPVRYNGALDNAAEKHAHHMSLVGRMAHSGIGDGDPGERVRAEGFRKAWGENVATGQTSPEQVVREWMNSPSHRRNILDPNFRQMGVGMVTAENGRTYWAQKFGAA
jgi:uncharacterized protein YkwD